MYVNGWVYVFLMKFYKFETEDPLKDFFLLREKNERLKTQTSI